MSVVCKTDVREREIKREMRLLPRKRWGYNTTVGRPLCFDDQQTAIDEQG